MMLRDQVFLQHLVQVFEVLGDEKRLYLLLLLAQHGELSISALCQATGQSTSVIQEQVTELSRTGYIASRREGEDRVYSVRSEVVRQVLEIILS